MTFTFEVKTNQELYTLCCGKQPLELGIAKWYQVNGRTIPVSLKVGEPALLQGLWIGLNCFQAVPERNLIENYQAVRSAYSDLGNYIFSRVESRKDQMGVSIVPGHYSVYGAKIGLHTLDKNNDEVLNYHLAYYLLLQKFNQMMEIEELKLARK